MPVCRFHDARRPDAVLKGPSHPQYKHGRDTYEARRNRVEAMTRIRALADLGVAGGFLTKRVTWVRFPSPAPSSRGIRRVLRDSITLPSELQISPELSQLGIPQWNLVPTPGE